MVTTWGGPDVLKLNAVPAPPTGSILAPAPSLPGFDRFMMERFSPLCWALPSNEIFNPKDAQGRQVLGEAAGLQQAIYSKTGQEYLKWLRDVELRNMGMNVATIDEYLNALCTFDAKRFRQYFQVSAASLTFPAWLGWYFLTTIIRDLYRGAIDENCGPWMRKLRILHDAWRWTRIAGRWMIPRKNMFLICGHGDWIFGGCISR